MLNILFVIDTLDYSGYARQLTHLAAHLPRDRTRVCVASLGPDAPWAAELRAAGVRVESLGWRWRTDLRPLFRLRRLHAEMRPDVNHAWGLRSASALLCSGSCRPGQLLVTGALPGRGWRWATAAMLRRVRGVIALGEAEACEYRGMGVSTKRLSVIAPGVPVTEALPAPATHATLPPGARVNLCLGPSQPHKGHREAAWAIDIMRMVHPDAHLVLAADGPGLDSVRSLMRTNDIHDHVHLLGQVNDVRPWLMRSEAVWVPSLRDGGRWAVLEAMAAGRPVIASRVPGLAELVVDGGTGYLVKPGDRTEMCLRTRLLLDHPDLGAELGNAGKRRVAERFSLPAHVAAVMETLARSAA